MPHDIDRPAGKPDPNWPPAGVFAGTPAPKSGDFRPKQVSTPASSGAAGQSAVQFRPRASRPWESPSQIRPGGAAGRAHSTDRHPSCGRIRSRGAAASSLHHAERGDKASQEGCGRFFEALPSHCRFCHPKCFLRPRRRILPLTHSESPSLVAVRRPPFGVQPPEAASSLGGGAGFRVAKRGGVCVCTDESGDAQAVHGLVQGSDSAGCFHRSASL